MEYVITRLMNLTDSGSTIVWRGTDRYTWVQKVREEIRRETPIKAHCCTSVSEHLGVTVQILTSNPYTDANDLPFVLAKHRPGWPKEVDG